jgi:hypothetical protein
MRYEDADEQRAAELAKRIQAARRALARGHIPLDPDTPVPEASDVMYWGSELVAYATNYGVPEPKYLPILGETGFLRRGYSHILAAAPKMGKTELLLQSIADWSSEAVAYFTEEYADIWLERLARAQQLSADHLYAHVKFINLPKLPHATRLGAIQKHIEDPVFTVVLVDTIRAGLELEDENDNNKLRRQLEPLTLAAHEHDKTLLLVHHTNKAQAASGSQVSVAGGLDLQGAMDAVLVLAPKHRKQNTDTDTRRVLRGWGRMRCGGTLHYHWPNSEGPLVPYEPDDILDVPETITAAGVSTRDSGLKLDVLRQLAQHGLIECIDRATGEILPPDATAQGRKLIWRLLESDVE